WGWVFVGEDEASFGNDESRMILGGETSEHLTWKMPGLAEFFVTLYARDAAIGEALEIAVSADGQTWHTVPYAVHGAGEPAGGYLALTVEAEVGTARAAGSPAGLRPNFVRLTLKPVFPADAL